MSTQKEISESKTTIFIRPKEGFLLSFSRDLVTFLFLGLAIYVSQGSGFWTFIVGSIYILFLWIKISSALQKSSTTFDSIKSAIDFLEKKDQQ